MLTCAAEIDSGVFSDLVGGHWNREYASHRADGQRLFVFRRMGSTRDLLVLRNDDICPAATRHDVPGAGQMYCHRFDQDPALDGLQPILDACISHEVLRYRPGKRITVAAVDRLQRSVIVKCVAAGIDDIHQRQQQLWASRQVLQFRVSQPIQHMTESNTFIQCCLPGVPLGLDDIAADLTIASLMAAAASSLHCSEIRFNRLFDTLDQQSRSRRYARLIKSRMPHLAIEVDELLTRLGRLGRAVDEKKLRMVPIHGSLHSHQWLIDGNRLALIDFDRAAMGHAELDVATFLAELDYEPTDKVEAISRTFGAGFKNIDLSALAYYRAHKHLAKAFKASKITHAESAAQKTRRNLARAISLLLRVKEV